MAMAVPSDAVIAGLVPAISIMEARARRSVDAEMPCLPHRDRRDKPGDDGGGNLSSIAT